MKIHITIEATPEEIRETMGLPDLREIQADLLSDLVTQIKTAVDPGDMLKSITGGTFYGADLWEKILKKMAYSHSESEPPPEGMASEERC